jgi:hypothetical protein
MKDVENDEQEIEFFETEEMYALTDKVQSYEYINSKNLDHSISGETEEDLENQVSNFLEDLHGEMVDLVTFINENFKNIKIELPASLDIDRQIKHYKERLEKAIDKKDDYITPYWSGYQNGKINELKSIISTLKYVKRRIEL